MTITLQGSVWMSVDGNSLGGQERIALLASIAECGSITQAAKNVKMSYKAAWDAIDGMNHLAGEPLVERVTGGKGGGGTRLTPRGLQLVKNFQLIAQEHQRFITQLSQQAAGVTHDYGLIRRMGMKTSARNQFAGKIQAIHSGAECGTVNDAVVIQITGGQQLVATITHHSAVHLDVQRGMEVFALIKASSIQLLAHSAIDPVADTSPCHHNQLEGHIVRWSAGVADTEVVLELAGGATLVAIVKEAKDWEEGQKVTAMFAASSVMIGTLL